MSCFSLLGLVLAMVWVELKICFVEGAFSERMVMVFLFVLFSNKDTIQKATLSFILVA